MAVVIVESPAKAKTINKYLGKDFTVLASYGHVRDLPSKDGSVDPENEFEMKWEVDTKSKKQLSDIAAACKGTDKLILATDPDREGEAISWHLLEALYKRRALKKDVPVERVVFNAITKNAVTQAMKEPREVDMELVQAYLARRALDYLVGFNLSPVLWRKLPGSRSAGRVQSVCLRLVVEREMEIEAFNAREYWSIKTGFTTPGKADFESRLVSLDGKKLERFDLANEADATRAVGMIEERDFSVKTVEAKPATRNPSPPFMTSTLQQEASRKLGMGAQQAMRGAQKLYEQGHITYMRTDGIDMAPEAIVAVRDAIGDRYGKDYVPSKQREYKVKAKNAQEAHEAIRPTDFTKTATELKLDGEDKKLYDLIWKRAVSSQMESARLERTVAEITSPDGKVGLRATGQVIKFDGFLKVYEEGKDEKSEDDEDSALLPAMAQGDSLKRGKTNPEQHFTQPPPRYTEASLVKRMEELGIGRPSTYASIVTVIQDRGYVTKDKNRLIAEDKGRLVTAFLENYFKRYVEYDFTADLEERLDDVSAGKLDWKLLLTDFWKQFSADIGETKDLRVSEVLDVINDVLGPHVFPDKGDGTNPRECPICGKENRENGMLSIKTSSKFGAFIGCTNYPDCRYTRAFGVSEEEAAAQAAAGDGKELGIDEETGKPVTLKSGRFGPYVQLGEPEGEGKAKTKPPRGSIPKGVDVDDVDFDLALKLIKLPRVIGMHPEDQEEITAAIGRYGPFVKCGKTYANLSDWKEVFEVGMNRAVELIAEKRANPRAGRGGAAAKPPLKELGEHPKDGGPMNVLDGRYGPYVKWGKINATIPKDVKPEDVTVEIAVELIAKKQAKK